MIGPELRPAAQKSIIAHSLPGEAPWLVIHSDSAGVLLAFDDRLMNLKVGGLTGLGAGAFGGGRITSFPYKEITGIEFNGQTVTGVLEIVTPSYLGTSN